MNIEEAKRISRLLKGVSENARKKFIYTGDINVSEMALDAAKTIDYLIYALEHVEGAYNDLSFNGR